MSDKAIQRIANLLSDVPDSYYSLDVEGNYHEVDLDRENLDHMIRHFSTTGPDQEFFNEYFPGLQIEYDEDESYRLIHSYYFPTKDEGRLAIDMDEDDGYYDWDTDSEQAEELESLLKEVLDENYYDYDSVIIKIKRALTQIPDTSENRGILQKLAKDNNSDIRISLASNQSLSPSTLKTLLFDENDLVRHAVKKHPNVNIEDLELSTVFDTLCKLSLNRAIEYISNSTYAEIEELTLPLINRFSGIASPILERFGNQIPEDTFRAMLNFKNSTVNIALAKSIDTPQYILRMLSDNQSQLVRYALAGNPSIDQRTLESLFNDPDEDVSEAAANNVNAPSYMSEGLLTRKKKLHSQKAKEVTDTVDFEKETTKTIRGKANTDLELLKRLKGYLINS